MRSCYRFLASVVSILLMSSAGPVPSRADVIYEDFSSTAGRDPAHTTAWWDTVSGQLKLFPFQPSLVATYDTPGEAY